MKQLSSLQKKFLLYLLPGVAVLFTIAQPATVQLSFFTASSLGMLQARILRNERFREIMGLAPIVHQGNVKPIDPSAIDIKARVTVPGQFKYEPPTVQSSISDAGRINAKTLNQSPIAKLKNSYLETRKELKDFKDGVLKRAGLYQENTATRKESKQFLKRAEEYEKRRQLEQGLEAEARRRRRR